MEAAGIALGAVPVAVDLFKKAAAAYKFLRDCQQTEKTSIQLITALAIEQQRFIQWGQGSGLDSTGSGSVSDLQLDSAIIQDPSRHKVVMETLKCIQDVLTDSEALNKNYGIVLTGDNAGPALTRKISAMRRLKWAVQDKGKFGELLTLLKTYNDGLYNLHTPAIQITIARDVLATLISTTDVRALTTFQATASASSDFPVSSQVISATALRTLRLSNASPDLHSTSASESFTISSNSVERDSEKSRLATLTTPTAKVRVLLEQKLVTHYAQGSKAGRKGVENLYHLIRTLNAPVTAGNLRSMRCLGCVHDLVDRRDGGISPALVYELPPHFNPMEEPVSLYDLLEKDGLSGYMHDLDERFHLAKTIAAALHEMHCAGWMHHNLSSKSIIFSSTSGKAALGQPYLCGFEYSRPVTTWTSAVQDLYWNLPDRLYYHPSYIFFKYFTQMYGAQYHYQTCFRFRHDYYSLGLILLEIGLWKSLNKMDMLKEPPALSDAWFPAPKPWPSGELMSKLQHLTGSMFIGRERFLYPTFDVPPIWALKQYQESGRRYIGRELLDKAPTVSTDAKAAWEREFAIYLGSIQQAIEEEGNKHIKVTRQDAGMISAVSIWHVWDENYPLAILRRDAIVVTQTELKRVVGSRYAAMVLRCLQSDFGVTAADDEQRWLRAYNWMALKDLEKCCA